MAITGEARKRIRTVRIIRTVPPGQPTPDHSIALNEIEAKLIPEVDTELTLANLHLCKQKPEEDIPEFYAHLVFYWLRAHPMHNSEVTKDDRLLIWHIIKGLACEETKKRTLDRRPRTMAEALKKAKDVWGTQLLLSDDPLKGVPQGEPSVQEVGTSGKCLACDQPRHYVRDCRMLKDFKKKQGWKKSPAPGVTSKNKTLRGGCSTQRGKPFVKRTGPTKRRAEVAEMQEEEEEYEEPVGGSDDKIAKVQSPGEGSDQEVTEQGNA